MPLSLNEIRARALAFAKEWEGESSEDAEAKSFWDGFFHVFGVNRRRVATFETPVKKTTGSGGFIDLLWKGVLLVEHKSRGKDLDRAKEQAFEYFPGLKDRDLPRYVIVSDFARIRLYDLVGGDKYDEFPLADLPKRIDLFGFLSGYERRPFGVEDPANVEAADRLGSLHDLLSDAGYTEHPLRVLMVRILFCLFADDTMLFEKGAFRQYIEQRTSEDGADLGMHLEMLFEVLNTPPERRQKTLDEQLAAFPYVNGKLFEERLPFPSFNAKMRDALLEAAALDWSRISPAIFGSLFQSIMDREERRKQGAHYTTEANILKAINPLFMDGLREEFEKAKGDIRRLRALHEKLGTIRILDPACGCGNFLVIAYRELRALELDILRELQRKGQMALDLSLVTRVDVDQFYGIEIDEWPARIAEVAMWMMDHQMNMQASNEFGKYFARIPLQKSPNIVQGNALTMEWSKIIAPKDLTYIVGNPPFVGKQYRSQQQNKDLRAALAGFKNAGDVDYVAGWFYKAAEFIQGTGIKVALVSTSSITQGEQVAVFWPLLFDRFKVKIHFAHRSFRWSSEARGKAAVHVVIIGFGAFDIDRKILFYYEEVSDVPRASIVTNISPYLTPGGNFVVSKRSRPLDQVPEMRLGSKPYDGGFFILSDEERDDLLKKEPGAGRFLRRYVGTEELLNGGMRWCLWLAEAKPSDLHALPEVMKRVKQVQRFREQSTAAPTRKAAATPWKFFFVSQQPKTEYILVPELSSERRRFIPIGFVSCDIIASGTAYIILSNDLFIFGLLSSSMHMCWTNLTAGRFGCNYRYSRTMVYNTFPWPRSSEDQKENVRKAAQQVLDARALYPEETLARLYDPVSMPVELQKAHAALDRAVDAAYGVKKFASEADRVAFLLRLYQERAAPLIQAEKPKRRRQKATG